MHLKHHTNIFPCYGARSPLHPFFVVASFFVGNAWPTPLAVPRQHTFPSPKQQAFTYFIEQEEQLLIHQPFVYSPLAQPGMGRPTGFLPGSLNAVLLQWGQAHRPWVNHSLHKEKELAIIEIYCRRKQEP